MLPNMPMRPPLSTRSQAVGMDLTPLRPTCRRTLSPPSAAVAPDPLLTQAQCAKELMQHQGH